MIGDALIVAEIVNIILELTNISNAMKRLQNFAIQECCFILIIPLNNLYILYHGRIKTPIFRRFEQA